MGETLRIREKGLPNAGILEIEGAGHGFSGTAKQRVADEALGFLKGIDALPVK